MKITAIAILMFVIGVASAQLLGKPSNARAAEQATVSGTLTTPLLGIVQPGGVVTISAGQHVEIRPD
jgi:hypothetical protein